jgi:ferritin-like protein
VQLRDTRYNILGEEGTNCGRGSVSRYASSVDYLACSESGRRSLRRDFLRGALAGAAVLGGASFLGRATGLAASGGQDTRILNLVLQLEYTEASFYAEALRSGALRGELREYAQAAERHEQAHVQFLRKALGSKAVARPSFAFGSATRAQGAFTRTAIKLEDLAVAAYNGQATNLSRGALGAAATIVSVEARHAAWIRAIAGEVAAPDAVDKPATAAEVEQGLKEIGMRP